MTLRNHIISHFMLNSHFRDQIDPEKDILDEMHDDLNELLDQKMLLFKLKPQFQEWRIQYNLFINKNEVQSPESESAESIRSVFDKLIDEYSPIESKNEDGSLNINLNKLEINKVTN
jgi:hypothetical protein